MSDVTSQKAHRPKLFLTFQLERHVARSLPPFVAENHLRSPSPVLQTQCSVGFPRFHIAGRLVPDLAAALMKSLTAILGPEAEVTLSHQVHGIEGVQVYHVAQLNRKM